MSDEYTSMTQFPQVARELMRLGAAGVMGPDEISDAIRDKFGLVLTPNESYFHNPVDVEIPAQGQGYDDEEVLNDEYPATG